MKTQHVGVMLRTILCCAGLACTQLCAQTTPKKSVWIQGQILHAETAEPIPGAWLRPMNHFDQSGSGPKGHFQMRIPSETVAIIYGATGFHTDTLKLSAPIPESLQLKLRPLSVLVRELEITAVRATDRMPIAQTTIHRRDIEKINLGRDIPMLLDQTPSVVVNSDAGTGIGYTGMRIRGTDPTRTNVTINGIPVNDAESQGVFWVNMPDLASSIATIQIQRGLGTSSHGAGAFGATVNIQTNQLRAQPFVTYTGSGGAFNTFRNSIEAGTGLLPGGFTVDLRLSKITSDGFVDRAWSDLRSYFLSAGWYGSKTSLRFNASSGKETTYQAWNGLPEFLKDSLPRFNSAGTDNGKKDLPYANETDNYQQDHYQFFINHQTQHGLNLQGALFYTRGRGYYEQYKVNTTLENYGISSLVTPSGDTIDRSDLVRQLWLDNHLLGGMFTLEWNRDKWQIVSGLGASHYIGNHYGKVIWAEINSGHTPDKTYYENQGRKTDGNIYGRVNYEILPGFTAFLDLQYRHVRYIIEGFRDNPGLYVDETFHFFNPKAGINYTTEDGHRWYFYYGMASKEPNRVDYEAPAAELPKPEQLRDLELGYEKNAKNYRFGLNAYWMDYTNQLILTGKINDVGAYVRSNVPSSYRLGMEAEIAWKPMDWLELAGNLNVSTNQIKDFTEFMDDYDEGGQQSVFHGNTPIAFSPHYVGGLTIALTPFKGAELALVNKWVGPQFMDNTGISDRKLPAFYVPDLRLRYQFTPGKHTRIELHATGYNLLDQIYFPNGYSFSYIYGGQVQTENYLYPMAGFHIMGGIRIAIGGE